MRTTISTEPGSIEIPNEDYVAATPTCIVVLDGLSAPTELGTGCQHGTPWYVHNLAAAILSEQARTPEQPLTKCLGAAIETVSTLHSGTCDLSHPGTPSSTVAIFRRTPSDYDWLVLADTTIILDTTKAIRVITDDRVEKVATDAASAALQHPTGSSEHSARVAQLVAQQRAVRNRPNGYWVAAATPEAAEHAVVGSTPHETLKRVVIVTDGVSRLVEWNLQTWHQLLETATTSGPHTLIRRVREAEASDPNGERWPRYKRSDDATAAVCQITTATY